MRARVERCYRVTKQGKEAIVADVSNQAGQSQHRTERSTGASNDHVNALRIKFRNQMQEHVGSCGIEIHDGLGIEQQSHNRRFPCPVPCENCVCGNGVTTYLVPPILWAHPTPLASTRHVVSARMILCILAGICVVLLDLAAITWRSAHENDLEILRLRQLGRMLQRTHPRPPAFPCGNDFAQHRDRRRRSVP